MERRRRDLLLLATHNDAEWRRDLPVTASLDLDHRPARNFLLRAVGDLQAGIAAEEPGARDHWSGREREQGNRRNDPAQHVASLTAPRVPGKERLSLHAVGPERDDRGTDPLRAELRTASTGFCYAARPRAHRSAAWARLSPPGEETCIDTLAWRSRWRLPPLPASPSPGRRRSTRSWTRRAKCRRPPSGRRRPPARRPSTSTAVPPWSTRTGRRT